MTAGHPVRAAAVLAAHGAEPAAVHSQLYMSISHAVLSMRQGAAGAEAAEADCSTFLGALVHSDSAGQGHFDVASLQVRPTGWQTLAPVLRGSRG